MMSEIMDVEDVDKSEVACANLSDPPATDVIVLDDDEVCDLTTLKVAKKCINYACQSGKDMLKPPSFCLSHYRVKTKLNKTQLICTECYNKAVEHYDGLVQTLMAGVPLAGIKQPFRHDILEIHDSDSDSDGEEVIDSDTMNLLEKEFDDTFKEMVNKYNFDDQINRCLNQLQTDSENLQKSFTDVESTYKDIRKETDNMIFELTNLMRPELRELPPLDIMNESTTTVEQNKITLLNSTLKIPLLNEINHNNTNLEISNNPQLFVNSQISNDSQSSNTLIPPSISTSITSSVPSTSDSISHITGDVIIIPADLPPEGEIIKQPLVVGGTYYTNRFEMIGTWVKAILSAFASSGKYEITIVSRHRTVKRMVTGKEIAYSTPANVRLKVGTRVIAVFRESTTMGEVKKNKKDSFYPGIVAEPLLPSNHYRYLIFFDDGYAQYASHNHVHLIHEVSADVTEDINVNARSFVKKYLENYESRALVRFLKDQTVRTEYNGKWWIATIINVDCSLVQVFFDDINRIEWIYRGSTRFAPMFECEQAVTSRQLKHRFSRKPNTFGPFVEFMRGDGTISSGESQTQQQQRSVARKSTAKVHPGGSTIPNAPPGPHEQDLPSSKIVSSLPVQYYTPRRQKPKTGYYNAHRCNSECRNFIFCPLPRMKGYSPLAKPLLCGFYRLLYKVKVRTFVIYRAPCGRTLRNIEEVHKYLRLTRSELTVDLFDFHVYVRCLAEYIVDAKSIILKDLSQGREECPITVCNHFDSLTLDFCNYSTKRKPMEGVNLNLDHDFLVCCDCTDDCADRNKCACWQLTLQCLKFMEKGTDPKTVGYQYRRLPEPIFTGIYECNSRCRCRFTCLNRVVQNPMPHKLQVFKTHNRGWGIRTLNDIPQGSFVCIYAGSLLTEEMANLDGKSYGDEYLAELDFIETAERTKEDYEEDPYHDEIKKEKTVEETSDNDDGLDDEEEIPAREDRDFVPVFRFPKKKNANMYGIPGIDDQEPGIRSRLRKRNHDTKTEEKKQEPAAQKAKGVVDDAEDTVMISDDEDYPSREPSSFNPMGEVDDKGPRKYKSVRELFGPGEDVYIMDAKNTGNIGRFLNHSCSPNIFVQNVFVDTHDIRFPWVAFFTMCYVRAGAELTWNYNYDIGSVPGKVLYCCCGSSECKGRLL